MVSSSSNSQHAPQQFIGLMSGTSLDGVDAVLASAASPDGALKVLQHQHLPFNSTLRQSLLALNSPGPDELHRAALAANAISQAYAQVVRSLLASAGCQPQAVRALGAHGQTVRHRPGEFDGQGYTIQLINGALLAELTGIDVVCDFRSRDIAAGGQGAPLVPAFHAAVFAVPGLDRAVLNLGGMANLTLLAANGAVAGFDCGPGNALLDLWCERHLGQAFDAGGAWAASGRVNPGLLTALMAEPFLAKLPPKSTGRDLFNAPWLDATLRKLPADAQATAADVQATLLQFTVSAAVQALLQQMPTVRSLLVCGGGVLNGHLMATLRSTLPGVLVDSTDQAGLPPMQVEAAAFAWLARACLAQQAGNCPAVTGAAGLRRLGAIHPAHLRARA